jgi:putative hemolysin
MPGDPFDLRDLPTSPLNRAAFFAARPVLERLFRLADYRTLYELAQIARESTFEGRALDALDIAPLVSATDLARIPATGPLVVAANHPHGLLDGLALAWVLRRKRSDVRILTNYLLARIPELADLCFFVDPFDGGASAGRSQAGLRAAHLWLKQGGSLVVFPAGEVSHIETERSVHLDSEWRPTVGRLALATGARVLPAFIDGANSPLFYAAGRLHPLLRTLLLPRELLRKRHQPVRLRLGTPMLGPTTAGRITDPVAATQTIRDAVESLREGRASGTPRETRAEAIAREVDRLPASARLVEGGAFSVFVAEADRIPLLLDEIGRLREATYREVGEGTGQARDLDAFDATYLHLFAWNRDQRRVVGAYRIGRTDRIVAAQGVDGLYTRRLFRYDDRLIGRLSPALELGRSFVRSEYQRNYNALLLLWKGIGQLVVRNPEYRILFGAVSISARYADDSHRLLMSFLEQNHRHDDLAALVEGIRPGPSQRPEHGVPRSVEDVDRLVALIEPDGKGMPILLRQYLKLDAQVLAFSVDPEFGDALDALMMVDLTAVEPAILNRYLGRQQAAAFLSRHAPRDESVTSAQHPALDGYAAAC